MIILNDVLSCVVCSNFESLSRNTQEYLRLCHQKWIPQSLEHWFWSERSNLSPEQKNSISVFSLGVFFDFLNLMFSWLCGVFRILWCYFLLLWYFSTFVVFFFHFWGIFRLLGYFFYSIGIFWLLWYLMTLVVFFFNVVVFFYFWGIFWFLWYVLWCFLWLGVFFDFLNM